MLSGCRDWPSSKKINKCYSWVNLRSNHIASRTVILQGQHTRNNMYATILYVELDIVGSNTTAW